MEHQTRPEATPDALDLRRAQPVSTLMRRHWVSTSPSATVAEVAQIMRVARLRQIPVEQEDVLVGMLDNRRLLASSLEHARERGPIAQFEGLSVASMMDSQPPTASPDETLGAVAQRMTDAGIGCLPVVEGEQRRLVGLVVESDLLRIFYDGVDRSRS